MEKKMPVATEEPPASAAPVNAPSAAPPAARRGDPCCMVIFGASGDLTKRKLIPSLYNLAKDNLLSPDFALIGFARRGLTTEAFRAELRAEIPEFTTSKLDPKLWEWLEQRIYYVSGGFGDPAAFQKLKTTLAQVDTSHNTKGNYFYYLATAPDFFAEVVRQLGKAGLWRKTTAGSV